MTKKKMGSLTADITAHYALDREKIRLTHATVDTFSASGELPLFSLPPPPVQIVAIGTLRRNVPLSNPLRGECKPVDAFDHASHYYLLV